MKLLMTKCKLRLLVLWFSISGFLVSILFLQTILGRYGDRYNEAWGWLMPNIMPMLFLILSVFVMEWSGKSIEEKYVDSLVYKLVFILSTVYLIAVSVTILLQPYLTLSPLDFMKKSNLWLGPFQGLVSASLGIFFIKKDS